jgi:outer membrane protein assembly factor BamB
MRTSELLFVGIKGSVVALNRATGEQVWATHLKRYDFVNVLVEEGSLLATCCGEIFCLEPATGEERWHNPLKGFGTGLATIATEQNLRNNLSALMAEKRDRDQAAAAAAAT